MKKEMKEERSRESAARMKRSGAQIPLPTRLYQVANRLADWRAALNFFLERRIPRVATMANPRTERDVRNLGYSDKRDLPSFLSWNRGYLVESRPFGFGDAYLEMFMIGSVASDIFPSLSNRMNIQKAKRQLMEAISHVVASGFDVVALTASTKRLLSPSEIRSKFPKTTFTLGDNLTALALWQQTLRVMEAASLTDPRVLVIGPTGFLGRSMIERLSSSGYDVVGLGTDKQRAEAVSSEFGVPIHTSIEEISGAGFDVVVACNHGNPVTRKLLEHVRRSSRSAGKMPVIDVCEPPAFSPAEVEKCAEIAVRVDADIYSDRFRFVLGHLAESNMNLGRGMIYPCFAEAMHLAMQPNLRSRDWLEVSLEKQHLLEDCLRSGRFRLPENFMSFGKASYVA